MLLAAMLSVHAAFGQSQQPQTNSAPSSQKWAILADKTAEAEPQKDLTSGPEKLSFSANRAAKPRKKGRTENANFIGACAAAVEDLKATRGLVEALETENAALKARIETARQTTDLLTELDATRKSETDVLRETVAAKNEAIAAKDAVIVSQDKLIEALKKKKSSPWKRLGDVLIGAAVIAVLK